MVAPSIQSVRLTHLRVAGLKPAEESTQRAKTFNESTSPNQEEATAAHLKPYGRLTADKPGEELASDAGIWQLYVEEASAHDVELVKEKNDNLDVMLLFAALFSAILTALLIESKDLLQEDSGDLTVTLLLAIAQSQQHIEQGINRNIPLVERPPFLVPASALWINGLWFTSLSISLAAALVAMLAKEWLSAFTTSRSRSARAYAHLHQARLGGMYNWRAIHIIDLLPSLIHLSLLLFSLGLCIYLWTLHTSIAIAPISISVIVLSFYLGTAMLSVIHPSSPFATQISKYLRLILEKLPFGIRLSREPRTSSTSDDPGHTSHADLQALSWLTENSRDPVISDCACQALAGLRILEPTINPCPSSHPVSKTSLPFQCYRAQSQNPSLLLQFAPVYKYKEMLVNLFDHICTRLCEAKIRQQRDLRACQGINVARYSGALPALVDYLERSAAIQAPAKSSAHGKRDNVFDSPAWRALSALDTVWSDDCPEFSPDAYALLLASDLRLTETITSIYHLDPDLLPVYSRVDPTALIPGSNRRLHQANESPSTRTLATLSKHERAVIYEKELSLLELRARYSRALFRTGILLNLHNGNRAHVTPHRLAYLLDSIRSAAQCSNLNPVSGMSTILPQPEHPNKLPEFRLALGNTGTDRYIPPVDIGDEDGLLFTFVMLLSSPSIQMTPQVELAAVRAFEAIGSTLVRQWLNIMHEFSIEIVNRATLENIVSLWPKIEKIDCLPDLPGWNLSQLLCVATIALSQFGTSHIVGLTEASISALHRRASTESGKGMICFMAGSNRRLFEIFVQMVDRNARTLPPDTLNLCLQIFLVETFEETILRAGGMAPFSLASLLRLLAKTPGRLAEVRFIFTDLRYLLPLYFNGDGIIGASYLAAFTQQSGALEALVNVAYLMEYSSLALDFVLDILKLAVKRLSDDREARTAQITKAAVPDLLTLFRLALCARSIDVEKWPSLISFSRNIAKLWLFS